MVTTMFMCICLQLETQMAQQKARQTGQQLVWQTVWSWASQKDVYVRVRSCVRVRVRNACIEFDAKREVTCESMPSEDEYVLVVAICPWIIIFSLMTSIGTHATEPHTCAAIPAAKLPRSLCGEASCARQATRECESRGKCQNAVIVELSCCGNHGNQRE
jgi:hypothetical protein